MRAPDPETASEEWVERNPWCRGAVALPNAELVAVLKERHPAN